MALYPLPPSSNESVIDNGRNVWQMALTAQIYFKDRLWRLTKAFTKHSLSMEGTGFQWNPHSSSRPAQIMRLSHACRNTSLEVQRPLRKEQGDNLEQSKNTIFTLLSFSACSKADGRCRSTRCRTGVSASAFKRAIDICRSTASACTMKRVQTPSPQYESSFVCPRVKFWDDPLHVTRKRCVNTGEKGDYN